MPDPFDVLLQFNRELIAATADLVVAFKPQSAHYEALGPQGMQVLKDTIESAAEIAPTVPVILDAKRADIGSSNEAYATAAFDFLGADAITVHPYLGPEAMRPFWERSDKGVIVLCRTSNPGAGHYQDLLVDTPQGQRRLFEHIAHDVAETWNVNGNCALVTGATAPEELATVRCIAQELPLLIPGIGAQGGDVRATVNAGIDARGAGVIINSSRALMYAHENSPDQSAGNAAREATQALSDEIRAVLDEPSA